MSLKEIARLSGTSVSTVSRVLNDPEHCCNQPGLSERIWEIAAQLNYLPNAAARNLRCGMPKTESPFTVDVFHTRFDSMEEDAFFMELFRYIREELLAAGCLLGEIFNSVDVMNLCAFSGENDSIPFKASSRSLEDTAGFIAGKENTGLIILGKCPAKLIPMLRKRYPCIAGIDRNPTDYEYDEVVCNGQTAAEKAVEYLISLGHKDIAYIGDCTEEARYIGYYQTLLNHKISLNHMNVHPTRQTREEGCQTMQSILQREERPTAIFCANDSTALGVLQALKQNKQRGYLPSVISIDNIEASQKTSPMLTTIDIPKKEMSHLALTLIMDRRNGRHQENVRIELPCRLIERESCTYLYQ